MKILQIGLVALAILALTCAGCTLIGANLKTEGYGISLDCSIAGFSTEAGISADDLLKPDEETP